MLMAHLCFTLFYGDIFLLTSAKLYLSCCAWMSDQADLLSKRGLGVEPASFLDPSQLLFDFLNWNPHASQVQGDDENDDQDKC